MAGRPTKLTPALLEKAKGYLDTCIDVPTFTISGAVSYVDVKLPSIVGLAQYLNINKDTVNEWCKDLPKEFNPLVMVNSPDIADEQFNKWEVQNELRKEFSVLVIQIIQEQERRLLNNGLGGLYTNKLAALVLGRYGYVEKTATDITTGGDKITSPVLPELIAEADRLLKEKKLNQ